MNCVTGKLMLSCEIAQAVKGLLCRREELSSTPRRHCEDDGGGGGGRGEDTEKGNYRMEDKPFQTPDNNLISKVHKPIKTLL